MTPKSARRFIRRNTQEAAQRMSDHVRINRTTAFWRRWNNAIRVLKASHYRGKEIQQ